jgi:thiamine pyrophosphate-dependent acetolactate synthase large subunit-like protein
VGQIVSEALIERLADWGVDTVFGIPGDDINGIMEGLRRHQDRIRFVLVHHEEAAAFMATGYAKATGRLGVCPATSGPGGIQVADAGADPWQHVAPARAPRTAAIRLPAPGRPREEDLQRIADLQVIAYVGDGGFAMLMAEFLTAIQHRLPVKVVVNNNNSLGQILWEQMVLGYPEHGVRYPEPFVNYAALADANGGLGIKVERPAGLRAAIERALGHDGPALVDVNVNPDEPPLPGKVEYQQAKKFAEAFLKGQPRKATIATTLFRDKIQQLKS